MFVDLQEHFQEIEEMMPHFLFYRKNRKEADLYCTACHDRYKTMDRNIIVELKHKSNGNCPFCEQKIQYRQMDRGRSTYYYYDNFAVFESKENQVRISCCTVYQRFEEDIMEPVYDYHEAVHYCLEYGSAAEYRKRFNTASRSWEWYKLRRKPSEPVFINGGFGAGYNGYHVIGWNAIDSSFLRYLFKDSDETELPERFITYYCRYAEHPQLEYLLHGGMRLTADAYVAGAIRNTRLNWKSSDLKKMLRVNKEELEFLKQHEGRDYETYVTFRRECCSGFSVHEIIDCFEKFGYWTDSISYISHKTRTSCKKVMNYVLKQKNKEGIGFWIHLWKDYLRECSLLGYDVHDESVSMPKKLAAAHERTSSLLKIETDAKIQKQMELNNQARQNMCYTDEKRGLVVIIPQTVEDIAREGRILSHCVGGYAQRHAEGKLHILFIRKINAPDVPYYTMEVNLSGKIIQCRGFKNNIEHNGGVPKPKEIIEFEKEYQEYLTALFTGLFENKRKSA